jgi:hypothetical protein
LELQILDLKYNEKDEEKLKEQKAKYDAHLRKINQIIYEASKNPQ